MLSVLFATEACYTIKENNNNNNNNDNIEKSFCQGKLAFYRHKLSFFWPKLRKAYFASVFSLQAQITILPTNIEKSLFSIIIFLPKQKTLNCKD